MYRVSGRPNIRFWFRPASCPALHSFNKYLFGDIVLIVMRPWWALKTISRFLISESCLLRFSILGLSFERIQVLCHNPPPPEYVTFRQKPQKLSGEEVQPHTPPSLTPKPKTETNCRSFVTNFYAFINSFLRSSSTSNTWIRGYSTNSDNTMSSVI